MEEREEANKMVIGQSKNKGIVVMPLELDFGASHQVIEIQKDSNCKALLGYNLDDEKMILLKEALKRADKVLVYRLNTGTHATYVSRNFRISAKSSGSRGNDISVKLIPFTRENWGQVYKNDNEEEWGQVYKNGGEKENEGQVCKAAVVTLIKGECVDWQVIDGETEVRNNDYVSFLGNIEEVLMGEERELVLSGGNSYKAKESDWEEFFETIRGYEWCVMGVTEELIKIKQRTTEFIRELREAGRSVYGVVANYEVANCMGIISIANGVKLENGHVLNRNECVAWMAGKMASFKLKADEVDNIYEGAIDSDKKVTRAQLNKWTKQGQIIFYKVRNRVAIVEDVNTFKAFTPKWGEVYRENAFIRLVDIMKEDFHKLMRIYYVRDIRLGKSREESKIYFKEICSKYLCALQSRGILYEVNVDRDLEVFLAEDVEGIDISLILKADKIKDKTYVEIPYNSLIS